MYLETRLRTCSHSSSFITERFGNHGRGAFGNAKFRQRGFTNPGYAAGVVGGTKIPADRATQVIHQHVVVFGNAGRIEDDPFKYLQQPNDLNLEASLFADLAAHGLFEAFTRFHDTAGQRPPVLERLASAFHQQDTVAFDDESSNAEDRALGILA